MANSGNAPKKRRPSQSRGQKPKPRPKKAAPKKKTTASRSRSTGHRSPQRSRAQQAPIAAPTEAAPAFAVAGDEQWTFRNQLKRISLKDRPTQIAAASITLIVILIAVIAAWPGSPSNTGDVAQGAAAAETETVDDLTEDTGGVDANVKSGVNKAQATVQGAFEDNPEADLDFAAQVASQIKPQSVDFPGGNPNTWVGVNRDTVKAVFSYDRSNCGVNLITAISAAGAQFGTSTRYYQAAPKNQEESDRDTIDSVNTLVKVFNNRGWEGGISFPQLKPLMEKFGTPDKPFYGRKLVHEFIDGGSFQCKPRTDAAAVDIVDRLKPFVVFNNFDGAQYNMAQALQGKTKDSPEKRPMHFGTLWMSDNDYTRWAPFNWTQFNSGTRGAELYMSWACSRLVGKKAVNAPDYKDTKRKFALLYPNLPEARTIGKEYQALSKKYCGTNIYEGRVFEYNPDPSQAANEGSTIAVNLKLDGVTTLTYILDPVFPIFQMVEFQSQDYQPEFAWTPSGYYDSSFVQRVYQSLAADYYVTSFGVSQFGVPGGFGFGAGDPFYAWHDTHKVAPGGKKCDPSSDAGMDHNEEYCKAPGALVTWYYTTLPLLAGILFSGPDLNPKFVSQGLQSYPKIRYGGAGPTRSPHPAQLGSGAGKHYFIVDGVEYRWRGDFVSPPPESKVGWITYPDCERHYNLWPDQLSTGWEKGGPNYGAYCGDAKYAPKNWNAPSEGSCEDDGPGPCKRDGYPRWDDY